MTDRSDADSNGAASLQLHDTYGRIEEQFNEALDVSLSPRGSDMLHDLVANLGLGPGATALDIGCGVGGHTIELAKRFGLEVLGVDPLARHIELARQEVAAAIAAGADLGARVRFDRGRAEQLPVIDGSMDLVWCRDVLVLVPDLARAYSEITRVLKPTGRAVVYQMFATERLEPLEAAWLLPTMGCIPANMRPDNTESAIEGAGLRVDECLVLGTEWGEFGQEQSGRGATKLLRAARLLREPGRYIARFGQDNYEIALGDSLWHVYRLIGKLSDRVYLLSPTSQPPAPPPLSQRGRGLGGEERSPD